MMNRIFDQLHLWFSLDSEPFLLAALMCLFGSYVISQVLRNAAAGIFFYPLLLTSSVVAIGIGTEHGIIGHWESSMTHILAAISLGMSASTVVLLSIIALYNRKNF
jgi:hypothetical protein